MKARAAIQLFMTFMLSVALIGQATFLARTWEQSGHALPASLAKLPAFVSRRLDRLKGGGSVASSASDGSVEAELDDILNGGAALPVTEDSSGDVANDDDGGSVKAQSCDGWDCAKPAQGALSAEDVRVAPPVAVRAAGNSEEENAPQLGSAPIIVEVQQQEEEEEVPASPSYAPPPMHTSGGVDHFCTGRSSSGPPSDASTSMTSYIKAGGRLPIMIVTSDRAEMLGKALDSLLTSVRCVTPSDIIVIQDGDNDAVRGVIEARPGVQRHVHSRSLMGLDGAARIASHYGYALGHALTSAFPSAPGVIVAEDDFLFSPDFYEYFHAVAPALEADPSLWLASSWNDNGFDYLVADPTGLRRCSYFPGLGWLLPRRAWAEELSATWPSSHWDHWMRDPARLRGRDVIIPEVPRVYHAGVKGTFMDSGTHNTYFGSIAMQADPAFTWDGPAGAAAGEGLMSSAWEARLTSLLKDPATLHIGGRGPPSPLTRLAKLPPYATAVVWYEAPTGVPDHTPMRPLAAYFGIWHEGGRGSWRGVHQMWWGGGHARLLLVNAFAGQNEAPYHVSGTIEGAPGWLTALMPPGVTPIPWTAWRDDPAAAQRPLLPRHGGLFGGKFSSPLAHLHGGNDANGAPDTKEEEGPSEGIVAEEGGAPAVPVQGEPLRPSPLPEGHVSQLGPQHAHSGFLGDLILQPAAQQQQAAGGDGSTSSILGGAVSLPPGVVVVRAQAPGISCDDVCKRSAPANGGDSSNSGGSVRLRRGAAGGGGGGKGQCAASALPLLNTCDVMRAFYACTSCQESAGPDQPAHIVDSAPPGEHRGVCLVNTDMRQFSCQGKYAHAERLCPCVGVPRSAAAVER